MNYLQQHRTAVSALTTLVGSTDFDEDGINPGEAWYRDGRDLWFRVVRVWDSLCAKVEERTIFLKRVEDGECSLDDMMPELAELDIIGTAVPNIDMLDLSEVEVEAPGAERLPSALQAEYRGYCACASVMDAWLESNSGSA